MTRFENVIVDYAKYHRDPRNIAYHSVGIPTIVFAVLVLLSKAGIRIGSLTLTPGMILVIVTTLYFISLDAETGAAMAGASALLLWLAGSAAELNTPSWLALGAGIFAGGWVLQFVGHGYEGRKPAFLDDLKSLAIGPLFVMVELFYTLGRKQDLHAVVEREAGPVKRREISPA